MGFLTVMVDSFIVHVLVIVGVGVCFDSRHVMNDGSHRVQNRLRIQTNNTTGVKTIKSIVITSIKVVIASITLHLLAYQLPRLP